MRIAFCQICFRIQLLGNKKFQPTWKYPTKLGPRTANQLLGYVSIGLSQCFSLVSQSETLLGNPGFTLHKQSSWQDRSILFPWKISIISQQNSASPTQSISSDSLKHLAARSLHKVQDEGEPSSVKMVWKHDLFLTLYLLQLLGWMHRKFCQNGTEQLRNFSRGNSAVTFSFLSELTISQMDYVLFLNLFYPALKNTCTTPSE